MLNSIPLEKVLFLDIETVPQYAEWDEMHESQQQLWDKKTKTQRKEDFSAEEFYKERGGIMAEFGKIICISVGILDKNERLMIKSFYGDDEKKLLEEKLRQTVDRLSARQRQVVQQRLRGRTLQEIAKQMGVSHQAVSRLLARAAQAVRCAWEVKNKKERLPNARPHNVSK